MKHKDTKYELPEDNKPTMVAETPAALQYVEDLRYGMEVLNTVSPDELHRIVVYLSDYSQEKNSIEKQFNELFEKWWNETCIYSGPNFCYENTNFKAMKKMGKKILPFIAAKAKYEPEYKQRHILWLRNSIEA